MPGNRVLLFHTNEGEAREKADRLNELGYDAGYATGFSRELLKALAVSPPGVFAIDLSRLPSHGRMVGMELRLQKGTRYVPLVFIGGEAEKVERIRQLLPDAIYTSWEALPLALEQAFKDPPPVLTVPKSNFDAYSGTPLLQKLGIKPGMRVLLFDAPADAEHILGVLPAGALLLVDPIGRAELGLWFVRTQAELKAGIAEKTNREDLRALWIIWPKKTSTLASDISERSVRAAGLAVNWVDYKVCAVDATWSGLLFARRKP